MDPGARRYPDPVRADFPPEASDALAVRRAILDWYSVAHRDFPWRGASDPWAVLVSEVMLQQTQASRVSERFPTFMARFPTPRAMARATDREVLAAWSGLGYNRRALGLRRAALAVERAGWPDDVAGLQALPGVGPYTARALAALAFGRPVGAVDTNVRRWLVRRFGLPVGAGPRALQALADGLAAPAADAGQAADWMHASMEFGARVCGARAPRCGECPVADGCPARDLMVHVPVARQAPFSGSARAARGAILRELAHAPGHGLATSSLADLVGADRLAAVIGSLERDGLAHRADGTVHLGPPGSSATAATIEA
jgi:A/G-specific adenine glycosylase